MSLMGHEPSRLCRILSDTAGGAKKALQARLPPALAPARHPRAPGTCPPFAGTRHRPPTAGTRPLATRLRSGWRRGLGGGGDAGAAFGFCLTIVEREPEEDH